MKPILGIDTSNYTTSIAVVQEDSILLDQRIVLEVGEGKRGLQQSQAFFQHSQNLPALLERIDAELLRHLGAVCVSDRPRPQKGSYMPVFLAGLNAARIIAKSLSLPLYTTTHQQGHIMAGEFSSGSLSDAEFLAVHLSGGTTEVLRVTPLRQGYDIALVGGTNDLNAGQFVDRVGVALGLSFPCGAQLEKLAMKASGVPIHLPVSVEGLQCSFSGTESAAQRLIAGGVDPGLIAAAVQECISITLEKMITNAVSATGIRNVLIVGGVASNQFVRGHLSDRFQKLTLRFGQPALSGDNAVGVARLGAERME